MTSEKQQRQVLKQVLLTLEGVADEAIEAFAVQVVPFARLRLGPFQVNTLLL